MRNIIVIGLLTLLLVGCSPSALELCIQEKGLTMYGAFWCPHCQAQKALYSAEFDSIVYIECSLPDKSGQTQVCKDAGIESYPTWQFADGSRLVGEVSRENMAKKLGCAAE